MIDINVNGEMLSLHMINRLVMNIPPFGSVFRYELQVNPRMTSTIVSSTANTLYSSGRLYAGEDGSVYQQGPNLAGLDLIELPFIPDSEVWLFDRGPRIPIARLTNLFVPDWGISKLKPLPYRRIKE